MRIGSLLFPFCRGLLGGYLSLVGGFGCVGDHSGPVPACKSSSISLFLICSCVIFGLYISVWLSLHPLVFVGLYGFRSGLKIEDGVELGWYLVCPDQGMALDQSRSPFSLFCG